MLVFNNLCTQFNSEIGPRKAAGLSKALHEKDTTKTRLSACVTKFTSSNITFLSCHNPE